MDNNSCTSAFNLLKEDFPKFQQTITSFIYISFEFPRHCVTSRWKNSRARTPLPPKNRPQAHGLVPFRFLDESAHRAPLSQDRGNKWKERID